MRRWGTAAALAAVAALTNANFLLAPLTGSRVDLGTGVISELSVPSQPGSAWFRLGDGTAGVLGVALAVLAWRAVAPRARFRAVCLAAFGAATLASALVPLTCAPSLGPCPASASGAAAVHDGVSVVATTAAVLGGVELAVRARGWLRPPAVAVAAVALGCGLYEAVTFALGGTGGGGAAQRWQVLAVSAWLVLEVWTWRAPARR
ncbi:DUF998 domain-containing protein [Kineococcus sp. SYSU DK002]|uniref:DUF998 domain-containing protein n=1 Tax=Kineococcus sp. SYSU DK002 TaxID=3383123 RepID=UPI003D7E1578